MFVSIINNMLFLFLWSLPFLSSLLIPLFIGVMIDFIVITVITIITIIIVVYICICGNIVIISASSLLLWWWLFLRWLYYSHTTPKLVYDIWYLQYLHCLIYLNNHVPHSTKYVCHTLLFWGLGEGLALSELVPFFCQGCHGISVRCLRKRAAFSAALGFSESRFWRWVEWRTWC